MNASTLKTGKTSSAIPSQVNSLLSALRLTRPNTNALQLLSDDEWASLLAFCDIAHLTLPAAQLPMTGFPQWVVDRLRTNLADNALRSSLVMTTYREAADALDRAGIEHIVIKGFTQAPEYVANLCLRGQSDIDIFCPPECIDAANRALRNIGYEPSEAKVSLACTDHGAALIRRGNWRWQGNLFDPEMPLGIELHFCLWNEAVSHISVPEAAVFWERRVTREVDGLRFACLNRVDHLAHLALHILRNLFLGDWIVHHVRELAVFLHSHADDDRFWRDWHEAHSASLRSLTAIAFYHALAWFDCRLHPLAAREIDMLPSTRQSWLRRFSGSALEVMFQPNKDALWLQLSFATSSSDRWKIIKQTLIPARLAAIDSPAVTVRNKRLRKPHPPWQQYTVYLISRSIDHSRAGLSTLIRGLSWRLTTLRRNHPARTMKTAHDCEP